MKKDIVIIGAGPAGLTAGYSLLKKSGEVNVTVIEADPKYVGGISRTVEYKGFRFDIGGHRFFSKSKEVEDFWTEILPNDLLDRPRSSRIFYRGKFFSYPLKATEALFKLGVFESTRCVLSYAKAQLAPVADPNNFEDWVSNKFGKHLFSIFFKTYTEKVWGMDCRDISADWAAQRIKGLSLGSAIKNALIPKKKNKNRSEVIKTLIDTFRYPRLGPGMMWEACAEKIKEMGGSIMMGQKVTGCRRNDDLNTWTITVRDADGQLKEMQADNIISSAPLRETGLSLLPKLSENAVNAAASLKYRDFITVALIVRDREQFTDNWIYIHDPNVQVGRVQNFKSWSPEMIPDPAYCCYGLEYFCFKGDGLWSSSDEELIELAKSEIEKIGLAKAADVTDGCVVRQPKAYPIYDDEYAKHVETLKLEMEENFPTLHVIGRNGMHKYNNQDHAMMTAMLCVENILAGQPIYNLWEVNEDAEYHEEGNSGEKSSISGLRSVPTRTRFSN